MMALENMAAEQKSSTRFMNFFRNHKKSRIAAGVALGALSTAGIAAGQPEIFLPALAARSAIGAVGGYALARTLWDGVQGHNARRRPENDVRMVNTIDGSFGRRLTPDKAFHRMIRLQGAEARAGSHDPKRQRVIQRLGAGPVHEYFMNELDFSAGYDAAIIGRQVLRLYVRQINRPELRRLKSDQTESRKRHIAGLVGGVAIGALPLLRPFGVFNGFGIGGHSCEATASHHPVISKPSGTAPKGGAPVAKSAGTSTTINVTGNNDTVIIGSPHNVTVHGPPAHQAAHHAPQPHYQDAGISTSELHVNDGGGFISTMEHQYHLTAAQSDATYEAMYNQLYNAHGTYLVGSDIRISAPGDFYLPHHASAILRQHLVALHKLPSTYAAFIAHQHRLMLESLESTGTKVTP